MIRLLTQQAPYWLDLGFAGIKLFVRPATTALVEAARHHASRRLLSVHDGIDALDDAGLMEEPQVKALKAAAREGHIQAFGTIALAQAVILDWDGVMDEDGLNKAPVTPDTIETLMNIWMVANMFDRKYNTIRAEALMEGNVSAAAPAGSMATGAAAIIAGYAGTPEAPVPMADGDLAAPPAR
jgi:hypothetical protein